MDQCDESPVAVTTLFHHLAHVGSCCEPSESMGHGRMQATHRRKPLSQKRLEEIELALVKLSRVTGDRRYLDLAKFFLDQRGRPHTTPPQQFEAGSRFVIYNDLARIQWIQKLMPWR